jgi:hypothetical protein
MILVTSGRDTVRSLIGLVFGRLALFVLAVAIFQVSTQELAETFERMRLFRSGIAGSTKLPDWAPRATAIVIWALTALFAGYLLSELRKNARRAYAILVLVGSAVIAGYVASRLESAITFEQVAALIGAAFGAIDGFASWSG